LRFEEMTIAELKAYLDGKEELSPEEEETLKASSRHTWTVKKNYPRKKKKHSRLITVAGQQLYSGILIGKKKYTGRKKYA